MTPASPAPPRRVEQPSTSWTEPPSARCSTHLLRDPAMKRALVFTRTKHGANRVAKQLAHAGIAADAIHGNKSQNARERALADFKRGKMRVLVATDIAARGWTSTTSRTSSTTTCPTCRRPTCTASAAPAGPGAAGWRSFCDPEERAYLATSSAPSAAACRWRTRASARSCPLPCLGMWRTPVPRCPATGADGAPRVATAGVAAGVSVAVAESAAMAGVGQGVRASGPSHANGGMARRLRRWPRPSQVARPAAPAAGPGFASAPSHDVQVGLSLLGSSR